MRNDGTYFFFHQTINNNFTFPNLLKRRIVFKLYSGGLIYVSIQIKKKIRLKMLSNKKHIHFEIICFSTNFQTVAIFKHNYDSIW